MSNAGEWVGLAASGVVVLGAIIGTISWFIRHEVRGVHMEMKPNGGGSFRDHMDRRFDAIDERLNGFDERLATTEDQVWHRVRHR